MLSDFFKDLSEEDLKELSRHKKDVRYKKGENLFHEGTQAFGLYLIISGHAKLYKRGIDGKQQILRIAGPGDIVGYRSLFENAPYHVSAQALEDSEICCMDAKAILSLLETNPKFAVALLKRLVKDFVASEELTTSIAQRPVRERMAKLLLMLKDSYGRPSEQGVLIEIQLSREEIGEMIGVTRETATRLLSQFQREGLIALKDREITILNSEVLTNTARIEL
jgi:CRP/FNR family transcriptional regulator